MIANRIKFYFEIQQAIDAKKPLPIYLSNKVLLPTLNSAHSSRNSKHKCAPNDGIGRRAHDKSYIRQFAYTHKYVLHGRFKKLLMDQIFCGNMITQNITRHHTLSLHGWFRPQ